MQGGAGGKAKSGQGRRPRREGGASPPFLCSVLGGLCCCHLRRGAPISTWRFWGSGAAHTDNDVSPSQYLKSVDFSIPAKAMLNAHSLSAGRQQVQSCLHTGNRPQARPGCRQLGWESATDPPTERGRTVTEVSPASIRVLWGWWNSKLELVTKVTITFQSESNICLYRWHAELHLYPKVGGHSLEVSQGSSRFSPKPMCSISSYSPQKRLQATPSSFFPVPLGQAD